MYHASRTTAHGAPGQIDLKTLIFLTAACLLMLAQPPNAQPYPVKPIRCVVPYPAGGPTDIIGRAIAQKLAESVGQPVIIDNRGGAAGTIGAEHVARAPADGYTMIVATSAVTLRRMFATSSPKCPLEDPRPRCTPLSRL